MGPSCRQRCARARVCVPLCAWLRAGSACVRACVCASAGVRAVRACMQCVRACQCVRVCVQDELEFPSDHCYNPEAEEPLEELMFGMLER